MAEIFNRYLTLITDHRDVIISFISIGEFPACLFTFVHIFPHYIYERKPADVQHCQTAIKTYMRSKGRDLNRLMLYAEKTDAMNEVRRYTEVLLCIMGP